MSRRTTLGPISANANRATGPSSRMSLGPSKLSANASTSNTIAKADTMKERRMSYAPTSSNAAAAAASSSSSSSSTSSTSRQSIAPGRPSLGGAALNRNAQQDRRSAGRRSSAFGAKATSSASSGNNVRTDPRPISDKNYTKENIRKLILYLTSHNYTYQLSPKQLASPSTKDFRNILEFLFKSFDSNFVFSENFEEEVKSFLKKFGYPFAISNSALKAAGSPHTWPSLLAMLVWLTEILTYHEQQDVFNTQDVTLMTEDRLFFDYVSSTFHSFLNFQDDFTPFDEELKHRFDLRNAHIIEESNRLEEKIETIKAESETLSTEITTVQDLLTVKHALLKDIPTLTQHIEQNKSYLMTQKLKLEQRKKELHEKKVLYTSLEEEKNNLLEQIAAQPFTPTQITEMLHQKQILTEQMSRLSSELELLQKNNWDSEMELCKKMNELEKEVATFNSLAITCQLLPVNNAKLAEGVNFELKVNNNFASASSSAAASASVIDASDGSVVDSNLLQTIIPTDLTHIIKPQLNKIKRNLNDQKNALSKESKALSETLLTQGDMKHERQENVDILEQRYKKLVETYRLEKERMNNEIHESCLLMEDIELEINKFKNLSNSSMDSTTTSHHKLQALETDIRTSEQDFYTLEKNLQAEISTMLGELTEHKFNITDALEQLYKQSEHVKNKIISTNIQAPVNTTQPTTVTSSSS